MGKRDERTGNIYDQASHKEPVVAVTIGPSAVAGMSDGDFALLSDLAHYEFIDLCLLPLDHPLPEQVKSSPAQIGRVRYSDPHVILDRPTSSMLLGVQDTLEHFKSMEGNSPDQALEYLALFSSRDAGLLVGSPDAVRSKPKEIEGSAVYCSWPELLDHLRLICAATEHFEAAPRFTVNEGFYYLYRRDKIFPDFRRAWFYGRESAERRLQGLWTRLEFLCRSADAAEIASLRTPNNDTEDRALFHLAYHYILATGAFDDLAAVADQIYGLDLNMYRRTLRRGRQGRSTAVEAISSHNQELAQFLESERIQKAIGSFYPIRDALQHREFPYTVGMMKAPRRKRPSVMVVPVGAVQDLATAIGDGSPPIGPWSEGENMATAELNWLARSTMAAAATVVNGFMRHIPWRGIASENARAAGDDHWRRFEESVARFLGWPREPVFMGAGIKVAEE